MVVKQKSETKVREARQKRGREVQPASWQMIIQYLAGGMQFFFRGRITIKVVFVTSCWYSI